MIKIQDGQGKVYNEVKSPTVVYDQRTGTFLKIGEEEEMEKYFKEVVKAYRDAGCEEEAEDTCLMVLPKDQELVDKVFNITGYLGKLVDELGSSRN